MSIFFDKCQDSQSERIIDFVKLCEDWSVAKHVLASMVYKRVIGGKQGQTRAYETLGVDYERAKEEWEQATARAKGGNTCPA